MPAGYARRRRRYRAVHVLSLAAELSGMAVPVSRIAIEQPCALTLAHEDALLLVASGRRHGVYAVQLDGQVRLKANTRRVACLFFYFLFESRGT